MIGNYVLTDLLVLPLALVRHIAVMDSIHLEESDAPAARVSVSSRVLIHIRLRILETILFVYFFVVVEFIYTCKTGHFGKRAFVFMFVLLRRVCTYIRVGVFGDDTLCFCFCCFIE